MYGDLIPNVFELPTSVERKPRRWLMPVVMTAIVIGATLALVAINRVPSTEAQTSLVR